MRFFVKDFIEVHNPSIKRKDLEYVLESMIHDNLEYGVSAKTLETKLSERTGSKYCIALNSYYTAIDIVFEALNLNEGDEILIPSYTPSIYLDIILRRKLKPVVIDTAEKSYFPGIEQIQNAITDKTKVLIVIHNFGYTIDCSGFTPLVPVVLEDITKVPGALAGTKKSGEYGQYAISSFSSTELITTGDGAGVFCSDKKDYQTLSKLIYESATENESENLYQYKIHGLMPDINAAMGVSQLSSLEKRLDLRKKIGSIYEESLLKSRCSFIPSIDGCERYYADFPFQIKSGLKDAIAFFKKNGVEVIKPYEKPIHHYLNLPKENYPNTEKLFLSSLLIPSGSTLLKKDVEKISKLLMAMI
ncbi:MAG TPA: hypothetical protein DC057_11730 [Spirochaetia bacterium]|nr:hypothetical protein [Spirochaetia bacterium]